jgi:hypothetical protein
MGEDEASEAARAEIRRMAEGRPFLFIGLPAAMCGPYDDVVLPQGTASSAQAMSSKRPSPASVPSAIAA